MATALPPAKARQNAFEQAVAMSLHLWPALSLAVENSWGGPDSSEKRDWFAGVIVDMFPAITDAAGASSAATSSNDTSGPEMIEDIETMFLQVMVDEFEVAVDDDSALELARQVFNFYTQCVQGDFTEADALAERFRNKSGSASGVIKKADDQDQDTDWESSDGGDDDSDEDMDEAPALVRAPREKAESQVDEDGFTTVISKKRGARS
ncbi:rRNA accumulation-related protein [Ceratocystis pirilliformis]|uniref:rRNA accumulation-related protein n=1 Tax=Ceratocystis pirilliformis TaxID=259994 RepID=A0ABR3ZF84_9PEZI